MKDLFSFVTRAYKLHTINPLPSNYTVRCIWYTQKYENCCIFHAAVAYSIRQNLYDTRLNYNRQCVDDTVQKPLLPLRCFIHEL